VRGKKRIILFTFTISKSTHNTSKDPLVQPLSGKFQIQDDHPDDERAIRSLITGLVEVDEE